MIDATINNTTYQIRTNWNDVTFDGYVAIVKAKDIDPLKKFALYAGLPDDVVMKMKLEQFYLLMDLVKFMDEPDTVMAFSTDDYKSDIKISEAPYWKVEKCKQLLKDNPNPITVGAEIVELYTGDKDGEGGIKIGNEPVTKVIAQAAFFLNSCRHFLNGLKD